MGDGNGTEAEKRLHRCCFTGHRPEKLNCTENEAVALLTDHIRKAYSLGYTTFISGMARGIDIWAAEIVLGEKKVHPDIRLICALPHPDFEKRWNAQWQQRYSSILQKADLIKTICPAFSMGAYQKRNIWMVNHSALVLAFFNGESGGTANTIQYAQKQGMCVINVIGGDKL